jgi:hemerythrin superfamily protein
MIKAVGGMVSINTPKISFHVLVTIHQNSKTFMRKEQVEDHIADVTGKVYAVAGNVVGHRAPEQAGATWKNTDKHHAVTGDDQKAAKSPNPPIGQEATALLRLDHQIVSDLFNEYEKIDVQSRKNKLVFLICADLTIHAQVEEEIFYPALNAILKDKRLVSKAIGEHATLKVLIAEVEAEEPDGEKANAKIKMLSEHVKHHIQEEQNGIFPRATATKIDMMALGARVASRKEELVAKRARRA